MVDNCRVTGLTSKPELNGEEGVGVSFDPAKCRTNVRLADGRVIALRPSNLIEVRVRKNEWLRWLTFPFLEAWLNMSP